MTVMTLHTQNESAAFWVCAGMGELAGLSGLAA
jgi:hypothetical protein